MNLYDERLAMGPDIYYDPLFMGILEDHLEYLIAKASTRRIRIDPIDVIRYQCDFYGLLTKNNVRPYLWWITMRCTGLKSPSKVPEDLVEILVPEEAEITKFRQVYDAVANIKT